MVGQSSLTGQLARRLHGASLGSPFRTSRLVGLLDHRSSREPPIRKAGQWVGSGPRTVRSAAKHPSVVSQQASQQQPTQQQPPPEPNLFSAPLESFDKLYTATSRLTEEYGSSTYPYSPTAANTRSLKTLMLASLAGHWKVGKNILLSSPHPGAGAFMDGMVKATAREVGADVISLDYLDILVAAAELRERAESVSSPGSVTAEILERQTPMTVSHSFTLDEYHIRGEEANLEDQEAELKAMEEDWANDEEDESSSGVWTNGRSAPLGTSDKTLNELLEAAAAKTPSRQRGHTRAQGQLSRTDPHFRPVSLTLNLALNGETHSQSAVLPPTGEPQDFSSDGAGKSTATNSAALPQRFHWEQPLEDGQVRNVVRALLEFITARCASVPSALFPTLQSPRKLVIFLQDTTDVLEVAGDTGRKFTQALLHAVDLLRAGGIPVVLVAGCSPTLTVAGNVTRARDTDFLFNLLAHPGHRSIYPDDEQLNLHDRHLFATPLDNMTTRFDKIMLGPPGVPFEDETSPSQLREWLVRLGQDTNVRLADLNTRRIVALSAEKGITVSNIENVIKAESQAAAVPGTFRSIFHVSRLEHELWPTHRLDRLISTAVGLMLEEAMVSGSNHASTGPVTIDSRHLADAVRIVTEGDRRRIEVEDRTNAPDFEENELEVLLDEGLSNVRRLTEPEAGDSVRVKHRQPNAGATATSVPPSKAAYLTASQQMARDGVKLSTYEKRLITTVVDPHAIQTSFKDLVLPTSTKLLLQTLTVLPLLRPSYFSSGVLSRHSVSGVLLFGPPGTGKTMLASALAKHSAARFMAVSLSDIYDKYVGEGEKNVKAIFTLARKLKPCVVFLDEIDAVFGRRNGNGDQTSRREIVNEFMSEWDGVTGDNRGIIIVGATNRPFDLDDAILRRMPRRIMVDLPKLEQRQEILAVHLRDETLDPTLDLAEWAKRTDKYSGSDLKNLCVAAALARIRDVVGGDAGLETLVSRGGSEDKPTRPTSSDSLKSDEDTAQVAEVAAETATPCRDEGDVDAATPKVTGGRNRRKRPSDQETSTDAPTVEVIPSLPPLLPSHFEAAMKQVSPSLTDEMQTLIELRKWDTQFGERKEGAPNKQLGWGFSV
ncbi:hypothetical protein HKX48_004024 [Thoreauomyces humboldtii]|nr:hypothetical protein HKX48_004024 [Thoreauomyces humboldtii]